MRAALIEGLDPAEARHVAEHARDIDRREVLATWMNDDLTSWADAMLRMATRMPTWTVFAGDEPVAIGGFMPSWPGVMLAWMIGTERVAQVGATVHRAAARAHRSAIAKGTHRFLAASHADHRIAHHWLKRLGYRREGAHASYGKNREDFLVFGKVA